jgi:hypothetical protein
MKVSQLVRVTREHKRKNSLLFDGIKTTRNYDYIHDMLTKV